MVKSPCVGLCKVDTDTRICLGCKRTLGEIEFWTRMSDQEKTEVLDRIRNKIISQYR